MGIAIILAPFLLVPVLFLSVRLVASSRPSWVNGNAPGSPGFSARSNSAVIASLATSANTPWDWQELQKRMSANTLSDSEIAAAVDQMIAYLKTQPSNQPLFFSDQFLKIADSNGKISDEQFQRLAKAFYKGCTVSIAPTVRSGMKLAITVRGGGSWQLPGYEIVYAIRQANLDGNGNPVLIYSQYDNAGKPNPDNLSAKSPWDFRGHMTLNTSPGPHTLTFICDFALLPERTAPQILNNLPGQSSNWPKGRAAWTETVNVPVTVVSANQSPIRLETTPNLNPQTTGAIHMQNIRVIRKGAGQRVMVEMSIDGNAMPCSFDIFLRIAGQEYLAGQCMAWGNLNSGNDLGFDLPSLDPSVKSVDVVLRPDALNMETNAWNASVDRIWGSEVDLLNVPVQRHDIRRN